MLSLNGMLVLWFIICTQKSLYKLCTANRLLFFYGGRTDFKDHSISIWVFTHEKAAYLMIMLPQTTIIYDTQTACGVSRIL